MVKHKKENMSSEKILDALKLISEALDKIEKLRGTLNWEQAYYYAELIKLNERQ